MSQVAVVLHISSLWLCARRSVRHGRLSKRETRDAGATTSRRPQDSGPDPVHPSSCRFLAKALSGTAWDHINSGNHSWDPEIPAVSYAHHSWC